MMLLTVTGAYSQTSPVTSGSDSIKTEAKEVKKEEIKKEEKKWYDVISIRGYAQIRYNQITKLDESITDDRWDRFLSTRNGFMIRRARIIFSGKLNDHVSFYFQPDFANNLEGTRQNFVQLRDLYIDLGLDKEMVYRFRVGQSKVPYGFENMQSSQNRITLDRADPTNSAVSNERDLGIFFYWTPKKIGSLLAELQNGQMKGSGNYGMFSLGAYNGQTGNFIEGNEKRHYVARFTYPFKLGGQIIEPGIQGYTGDYRLTRKNSKIKSPDDFKDERVAASFVLYPRPFGIMAEYNIGKGPEFSSTDSTIKVRDLKGGYVQLMYAIKAGHQRIHPFVKYQYYEGGKKHEADARSHKVDETEFGVEWQPNKAFELTFSYTIVDRLTSEYASMNNALVGQLARLQFQVNF